MMFAVRRSIGFSTILLIAAIAPRSQGAVLWVPANHPTLQAAIDAAASGDEIRVSPGVYVGAENKNLDFQGKNLAVVGDDGAAATILDLEDDGRAFDLHSGESYDSRIEGFTIRNGNTESIDEPGGAIRCVGATVEIRSCVFEGCRAAGSAGALLLIPESQTHVYECAFRDNRCAGIGSAGGDGGAALVHGPTVLHDCLFEGNRASQGASPPARGGAISLLGGAMIEGCRLVSNEAENGWGGGVAGDDFALFECDVLGNTAALGGGIATTGDIAVDKTLIAGNLAASGGGLAALIDSYVNVVESTIASNVAEGAFGTLTGGGGILAFGNQGARLYGSILWGNCAEAGGSEAKVHPHGALGLQCSAFLLPGVDGTIVYSTDCVLEDPLFCDPLSCAAVPGTGGVFDLRAASPCLPAGNACGSLMGARDESCGPTPTRSVSWGGLKTHFR